MNLLNRMSQKELKKGAIYSLVNAHQLYGDALIMEALGRLSREYSFTKLALEESAKALMLFELYLMKNSEIPDFQDSKRCQMIVDGLDDHNPKTLYALTFLRNKKKEFVKYHPVKQSADSNLVKEVDELNSLIKKYKELDRKKNFSLYTSVTNNKFLPPQFNISQVDVDQIKHLTFQVLIYAKKIIIIDKQDYYNSIGLEFNINEKLDPNIEARNMHTIQVAYWNHIEDVKRKYPNLSHE